MITKDKRVEYDPIGVTKSRICSIIINSKEIRDALAFNGKENQNAWDYDPEEPMTLMWNCVYPILKDPDTITTSQPQILVGVSARRNAANPDTQYLTGTIMIILSNDDLRTNVRYLRDDLIEDGIIAYTKADYLAYLIKKALSADRSKTWIGDIQFTSSEEGATNNQTHYGRTVQFIIEEINPNNRGV